MQRRSFIQQIGAGIAVMGAAPAFAFDDKMLEYIMPGDFLPREVKIKNDLAPYEIHVDPGQHAFYWTLPDGKAIRYAVGIGRPGLYESGEFYVGAKKEWPSWTPTPDMIKRNLGAYKKFAGGMPGGLENPLGSRGLYLFQPGIGDTFLRIHGTHFPKTIGGRVSNGCDRLINNQMIELYDRVPMNSRVVMYPTSVTGRSVGWVKPTVYDELGVGAVGCIHPTDFAETPPPDHPPWAGASLTPPRLSPSLA
jgi:lipoprotein-anchoring transpeptidase ErfK/SrfK